MYLPGFGTVFAACLKCATGARAECINIARNVFPYNAFQCNTADGHGFCTFHADVMRADCGCQRFWNRALCMRTGLAPVKRHSERGAAGATFNAGLRHDAWCKWVH